MSRFLYFVCISPSHLVSRLPHGDRALLQLIFYCFAFSSNPAQRNLRISMAISLEAVGACLAGVFMIILARVLAFIAPLCC
jgi:hypothetical protein